jgi:hypothetical protein
MFIKQGFQSFDLVEIFVFRNTFSVLPDSQFKIFWTVILFTVYSMMNCLIPGKWSSENSCHDKSVFENSARSTMFLFHAYAKKLVGFWQTGNNKCDVTFACYSSCVSTFIARFCGWWSHDLMTTRSTQSSKRLNVQHTNSCDPTISITHSTRNSKSHAMPDGSSGIIFPMNLAVIEKIQSFNWFGVGFSTHFAILLFRLRCMYNSQLYHTARRLSNCL